MRNKSAFGEQLPEQVQRRSGRFKAAVDPKATVGLTAHGAALKPLGNFLIQLEEAA